jgi:hypothetical protein
MMRFELWYSLSSIHLPFWTVCVYYILFELWYSLCRPCPSTPDQSSV